MVKHIVMWKLKDPAHATKVKALLEPLVGRIPGLLKLEVGANFAPGAMAADVVLYSELTDRAALAAYQAHPAHQAVVPLIVEMTTERRVVDYET
jgi:quinol monooxygenase YgiN